MFDPWQTQIEIAMVTVLRGETFTSGVNCWLGQEDFPITHELVTLLLEEWAL